MRDLQAALRQTSTATLSMQLLKRGVSRVWMRGPVRLSPQQERLAAPAFTLRFIPGREDLASPAIMARKDLAQRRAIEECSAGHVLVVDALGLSSVAVIGDILATRLRVRGVSGMVTDGAVRDADSVAETGLPVWCAGAAAPPRCARRARAPRIPPHPISVLDRASRRVSGLSDGDLQAHARPLPCPRPRCRPFEVVMLWSHCWSPPASRSGTRFNGPRR